MLVTPSPLLPADLFPMSSSKSAERATASFLEQVLDILLDHVRRSNDRKAKILDWHQPNQLREAMDFSLPDQPQNLDQILVDCKDALKYQVKTGEELLNPIILFLMKACLHVRGLGHFK